MLSLGRTVALFAALALAGLPGSANAGPPGHWTQITKQHNGTRSNLGLARGTDGTLHVLWAGPGRAPYTAILDTPISLKGGVSKPQTVLSSWAGVKVPTAVTAPDGSIHVVVSGQKVNSNTDPFAGLNEVVGPGSWKLGAHAFGASTVTEASNADVRTAILKSGRLVSVWTTAAAMLFQTGVDPATQPQRITPNGLGNNAVIAVDQGNGDAVIAYHGVNSGSNFFRRIVPSVDAPQAMPQAKTEALSLVARDGGGVYTAYSPDGTKVWLLRFGGQPKTVPVPKGVQVLTAGIATGPQGRLWVFYGNQQNTYVTRTSKGVSCFEPVHRLASPPLSASYFLLEGEGSAGPLDLFTSITVDGRTKDGSYHQHVQPVLSLAMASRPVRNKKGKVTAIQVTVRVLDACDGVAGATVAGLPVGSRKTGAAGSIVFTVSPGKHGSFALTAKKAGYIRARGRLSL